MCGFSWVKADAEGCGKARKKKSGSGPASGLLPERYISNEQFRRPLQETTTDY
jgi:hypothetical protein